MSTRDISTESYQKIRANGLLSNMRMVVYDALFRHGPCTANELFTQLNLRAQNCSNITTRLGELRKMGVASEVKTIQCRVTGMTVTQWDVTSKLPAPLEKKVTRRQKIKIIEKDMNDLLSLATCFNPSDMEKSELQKIFVKLKELA